MSTGSRWCWSSSSQYASSKASFPTGHTFPDFMRTAADQTKPWTRAITGSTTHARRHYPSVFFFDNKNKIFAAKIALYDMPLTAFHPLRNILFCLQQRQNWPARNCVTPSTMNTPRVMLTLALPRRKWLDVRALRSVGDALLPPYTRGQGLRSASTSAITVRKTSSTVRTFPSITFIECFVHLIKDSQATPKPWHG